MKSKLLPWAMGAAVTVLPYHTYAVSFGIFDARALALGGTGVAMGDLVNGHFYNPSLIALHVGDEDVTDDGRHLLPTLTARYTEAAEIAYRALRDDLEGELTNAIDNFNMAPGPEPARGGEQAALELKEAMLGVQDEDIFGDVAVGYSVTEPGHKQGGAFFVMSRTLGNGVANIEQDDLELIDDYVEALRYIYTEGTEGEEHPELFDENGRLTDPVEDILSSARGRMGTITEVGVTGAKLFKWGGHVFAFGVSPKAVYLQFFDGEWEVVNRNFESNGVYDYSWTFNMDLGMTWAPSERLRVGLATKDIITQHRTSELGYQFTLKPRTRLGVVYDFDKVSVGMDLDLTPNTTFVNEIKQQDFTLGVEYSPLDYLRLRAGAIADLEGTFKTKVTLGCGVQWRARSVDVAYATGSSDSIFGLQFGIAH